MKANLPNDYRSSCTLEMLAEARAAIAQAKNDTETPAAYLHAAAAHLARFRDKYVDRVIEANARAALNCALDLDQFGEGCGCFDIWIEGIVRLSPCAFAEVGAYLTDIWNLTGDPDEDAPALGRMWWRLYTPQD